MASPQPFEFVLPESADLVSGGNLYNAELLASLEERYDVRRQSILRFCSRTLGLGTFLLDSINLPQLYELDLKRTVGRNLVLLVHHLPSLEPGLSENDAGFEIENATLPLFDAFVCTSDFTASHLRTCGWMQPSITIEPVITVSTRGQARSNRSAQALMSCNLIRRKGVLEFLQALSELTEMTDTYQLRIVGRHDLDLAYSKACINVVRRTAGLRDRVTLPGESPKSEMTKWYEGSNLFVSASRMETFGISLQEARSCGLPILAVRGGNSANHVIPGVTGLLCDDPTRLATEFLAWARDTSLLSSFLEQAQARQPLEGGDWGEAAEQLAETLTTWFPCD